MFAGLVLASKTHVNWVCIGDRRTAKGEMQVQQQKWDQFERLFDVCRGSEEHLISRCECQTGDRSDEILHGVERFEWILGGGGSGAVCEWIGITGGRAICHSSNASHLLQRVHVDNARRGAARHPLRAHGDPRAAHTSLVCHPTHTPSAPHVPLEHTSLLCTCTHQGERVRLGMRGNCLSILKIHRNFIQIENAGIKKIRCRHCKPAPCKIENSHRKIRANVGIFQKFSCFLKFILE